LPAEFEPNRRSITPLWSDPRTAPGELLWGDRVGQAELTEFKTRLGSYGYAGQFQQRPSPATGGLFKRDWWQFYRVAPAQFDRVIQSWDCTFKDAKTSDFVVGQVWGKSGSEYYLLDQVRDRMDINATLTAIRSLSAKWPQAKAKLVEDKANGSAVIDLLKREVSGLIAINPQGGKVVRATAIAPYIEAGNVYLPDPSIAPWVHDLVEEFSAFPNGANDDQVDGCSQAIAWLEENKPFAIRSSGIRVY
jgi:predicted phage terminase large subunit-like protein